MRYEPNHICSIQMDLYKKALQQRRAKAIGYVRSNDLAYPVAHILVAHLPSAMYTLGN